MAQPPRRLWDSSVIIGYLAGSGGDYEDCAQIIGQAERGEFEIVVSAIATIEVAYLKGVSNATSEAIIQEFFGRNYIILVNVDPPVTAIARRLVRTYRSTATKLKPFDATHLATAIHVGVPLVETADPDLLRLDQREGSPPTMIRKPVYQMRQRLLGI